MKKILGYILLVLGCVLILFGCFELMTIKDTVVDIKKAITETPDPLFKILMKTSFDQTVTIIIVTYILPGFILSALGSVIVVLSELLHKLDIYFNIKS